MTMKKLFSKIGIIAILFSTVFIAATVVKYASADVTVNNWIKTAITDISTNTGNGLANANIHVAGCYIGTGFATPCGAIGSGIAIGDPIGGGTDPSVLFIDGGLLAQDPTNFYYDPTVDFQAKIDDGVSNNSFVRIIPNAAIFQTNETVTGALGRLRIIGGTTPSATLLANTGGSQFSTFSVDHSGNISGTGTNGSSISSLAYNPSGITQVYNNGLTATGFTISYSNLVGGPFQVGETITNNTTSETGTLVYDNSGASVMVIDAVSGSNWNPGDQIEGSISLATADIFFASSVEPAYSSVEYNDSGATVTVREGVGSLIQSIFSQAPTSTTITSNQSGLQLFNSDGAFFGGLYNVAGSRYSVGTENFINGVLNGASNIAGQFYQNTSTNLINNINVDNDEAVVASAVGSEYARTTWKHDDGSGTQRVRTSVSDGTDEAYATVNPTQSYLSSDQILEQVGVYDANSITSGTFAGALMDDSLGSGVVILTGIEGGTPNLHIEDVGTGQIGDIRVTTSTITSYSDNGAGSDSTFTQTPTGFAMTDDLTVPAEACSSSWNGSNEAPTKNDTWDCIQALPTLAASTFSPTASDPSNLDATPTPTVAMYQRVGNFVTVSGQILANPTTTLTATSFYLTLPIASAISNSYEINGTFCNGTIATGSECGQIVGEPASNKADFRWVPADTTNQTYSYIYQYQII